MNVQQPATRIKLVECPRDAMQGWKTLIPSADKIRYINALLQVGFDTIDFGSFVSPKAIPQMADTKEVLAGLNLNGSSSKLLAIVANRRGAEEALEFEQVSYLGFPFSISQTFQLRNTNSTIDESLERVAAINKLCNLAGRQLVVYMSMGFGNPYGDEYSPDILSGYIKTLVSIGVNIISLADTVGLATPDTIAGAVNQAINAFPGQEIGVHLHSTPTGLADKLQAAFKAGCTRFDSALKGVGGCPMAGNELVGNFDTGVVIDYFDEIGISTQINKEALQKSTELATAIFG